MAYETTPQYKNAIRQSGTRKTVVDLYYNRQTTPVMTNLPLISGSINVDGGAATLRSGSLTLNSPELLKPDPPFTLEPFGMELGIRMGVVYNDGTEELIPVGKFQITDVEYSEDTNSTPTITFQDRSIVIAETSSKTGFVSHAGKGMIETIRLLLTQSPYTDVTTTYNDPKDSLTLSNKQLNLVVDSTIKDQKVPAGDPFQVPFWDEAQQLAATLGAELYFWVDGCNVILKKPSTITTSTEVSSAKFIVDSGPAGTLINVHRGMSRQDTFNGVVNTGTLPADAASTTSPPVVFVYDNDPQSRTYYWGPFGKKVFQMTTDNVTNKGILESMALSRLTKLLSLSASCSFEMVPDPSIENGDIVKLVFLDGDYQLHVVQGYSLDLMWGSSMSVTTRGKQG